MATLQRLGLGLVGAGTTMLVRRVARQALYDGERTRLPSVARRQRSVGGLMMIAAAAGALLALADVLQDQRGRVAERTAV